MKIEEYSANKTIIAQLEQAKEARQDIRSWEAALNLYKLGNCVSPTTDQGLEALIQKPSLPEPANWKMCGYLDRLPLDPWQQPYLFLDPGNSPFTPFRVCFLVRLS